MVKLIAVLILLALTVVHSQYTPKDEKTIRSCNSLSTQLSTSSTWTETMSSQKSNWKPTSNRII